MIERTAEEIYLDVPKKFFARCAYLSVSLAVLRSRVAVARAYVIARTFATFAPCSSGRSGGPCGRCVFRSNSGSGSFGASAVRAFPYCAWPVCVCVNETKLGNEMKKTHTHTHIRIHAYIQT